MSRAPGPLLLAVCALGACATPRDREDPDWYDAPGDLDVGGPIAFTDQPYDFPAPGGVGIADLPMPPLYTTWFAPDDAPPAGCADWTTSDMLPLEVEGIVTVYPRMYFKVQGCGDAAHTSWDSDEKYYGSYFLEDATGGVFVLGDTKVAHFDMGDRVRLKVRAVKNNFDLKMVAAHDVLEVVPGPEPIHYEVATAELGADDIAEVRRITGVVATEADTFGEFAVTGDDGQTWLVAIDQELSRRGVAYAVGSRIEVTGPVMYSYSAHTVVVTKIGQVTVLQP